MSVWVPSDEKPLPEGTHMADKTPEEIEANRAAREAEGRRTTPAEQIQRHEGVKPLGERDQARADGATEAPPDESREDREAREAAEKAAKAVEHEAQ